MKSVFERQFGQLVEKVRVLMGETGTNRALRLRDLDARGVVAELVRTRSGSSTGTGGPATTDDLPEGSINQYFTGERVASSAPVKSVAGLRGDIETDQLFRGLGLGSAAKANNDDFATAAQGQKAESAIQDAPTAAGVPFLRIDGDWAQVDVGGDLTMIPVEGDSDTGGSLTFDLILLEDTGIADGPVRVFDRDAKGRIAGSRDASTTDLPEGENLYHTGGRVDARIELQKGVAGGLTPLGADRLIPTQFLPPLAITRTFVVKSQAEQLALVAQEGDVAIRTDLPLNANANFIHNGGTTGTMADWTPLLTPAAPVQSVNGQTGNVTVTPENIGAATTAQGDKADTALQDAPKDGRQYARASGAWTPVTSSGGSAGRLRAYLADGTVQNIGLTADGKLPAWLADGTRSDIQLGA